MNLPHQLSRSVEICATPSTVFDFLSKTEHWATWWGAGSTIDARPGGRAYIRYPNGVEVLGEVQEVNAPHKIVFTYGYGSGNPIPPGASRVTITLAASENGTRLELCHEFADATVRDQHIQGWRFQLSVFANVVANVVHSDPSSLADRWFDVWADPDAQSRSRKLIELAAPGITFRDRYSLLHGHADLESHIAASQRFMPGISMRRLSPARHCQGVVLVDWIASNAEGKEVMRGSNVMELSSDGRIKAVVGISA